MREITSHIVNPVNDKLKLTVTDEPGPGGANHRYLVELPPTASMDVPTYYSINFQNGPIAERGVNGLTQEVLLAIVADRLQCFQAGPFSSELNATALKHVEAAQEALLSRTRERMARGVEGRSVA